MGFTAPNWEPAFIASVPGSSFDVELPKRGPTSLLEMIEHKVSGKNYMQCKYPFIHRSFS